MIPENITKLVDKALFEAWIAGRTGESGSRAVRLARPILLDAIEAELSKPAVPEDIGKLVDAVKAGYREAAHFMRNNAMDMARDYPETIIGENALTYLESAIAALANRAGVKVKELEWPPRCPKGQRVHNRPAAILVYEIAHYGGDVGEAIYRWAPPKGAWSEPFATYEAAKAAAQADYEQHILSTLASAPVEPAPAAPGWQSMDSAPKDGTHILAILHREACEDMDGIRRPAFSELREIWYRPYQTLGMNLPWHAGDPFDSHDGMAPDHMGEDVPVRWMPLPTPDSNGTEGGE